MPDGRQLGSAEKMKRNVSVELSNRELWLLTASIDTDIKDRKRF